MLYVELLNTEILMECCEYVENEVKSELKDTKKQ